MTKFTKTKFATTLTEEYYELCSMWDILVQILENRLQNDDQQYDEDNQFQRLRDMLLAYPTNEIVKALKDLHVYELTLEVIAEVKAINDLEAMQGEFAN